MFFLFFFTFKSRRFAIHWFRPPRLAVYNGGYKSLLDPSFPKNIGYCDGDNHSDNRSLSRTYTGRRGTLGSQFTISNFSNSLNRKSLGALGALLGCMPLLPPTVITNGWRRRGTCCSAAPKAHNTRTVVVTTRKTQQQF